MRLACALAAALPVIACAASIARAGGAVRIAIAREGMPAPVATRLEAELAALGFEVVDAGGGERSGLADIARRAGAAAVVRAVPSASGMEVWVESRTSPGKRAVVLIEPARGPEDATIALRTVEVLRASLLDVPARSALPATPPPPDVAPPPLPRFGVELGPAVLASPGGLGPAPALALGARWMPGFVGIGMTALIGLYPSHVSAAEGTVALHSVLVGAGLRAAARIGGGRVMPSAELGIGGVWLRATAEAQPGYVAQNGSRVFALPYLRAGLAVALGAHVAVRADLLAGIVAPTPQIVFGDRVGADWGSPLLAPSLGLDLCWR